MLQMLLPTTIILPCLVFDINYFKDADALSLSIPFDYQLEFHITHCKADIFILCLLSKLESNLNKWSICIYESILILVWSSNDHHQPFSTSSMSTSIIQHTMWLFSKEQVIKILECNIECNYPCQPCRYRKTNQKLSVCIYVYIQGKKNGRSPKELALKISTQPLDSNIL